MTFEESYQKVLSQIPDEYKVIGAEDGLPDFEIRLDKNQNITFDIYFCLLCKNNIRMNIRTKNGKILEVYPICSKDSYKDFDVNEDDILPNSFPYLSINTSTNMATHFYYLDKSNVLTRVDKNHNKRIYKFYLLKSKDPNIQQIFDKYHPLYIYAYYDNDIPTSYLLGFQLENKFYENIKQKLSN